LNDSAPLKEEAAAVKVREHRGGSLTRRMIGVSALWISVLLLIGGYALDRVLSRSIVDNFDQQLEYVLNAMIAASEIGPDGEVRFSRPPADQRFLEPYSGAYFQISGKGQETFPSRSLWDRRLAADGNHQDIELHKRDSFEFEGEPLRILERDVVLPGSKVRWRFQVAQSRDAIDGQIRELRATLVRSFAVLGLGLLVLAALQAIYGLWPLRRVRQEVVAIRSGTQTRIAEDFPREINPPLTVITNAATAHSEDLDRTVIREAAAMRRQVDHHLARARAIGRRASAQARAIVWTSVQAVERAVTTLYDQVTIDVAGDHDVQVRVERQDLDEMLGNLVENAAKYGNGRVFVTVEPSQGGMVAILIEDDGPGIPAEQRAELFTRGTRLDTTGKPGTGLGLAIARDVAEIYGGSIRLEESEDLGGLLARLTLPAG